MAASMPGMGADQPGLTISIRRHDSADVLASAHVEANSNAWTKYSLSFDLPANALHRLDPADFVAAEHIECAPSGYLRRQNQSGSDLMLLCVNRSLETDIPADIRIDGFASAQQVDIETLRADSIDDVNDEDEPDHVIPVHMKGSASGGSFDTHFRVKV